MTDHEVDPGYVDRWLAENHQQVVLRPHIASLVHRLSLADFDAGSQAMEAKIKRLLAEVWNQVSDDHALMAEAPTVDITIRIEGVAYRLPDFITDPEEQQRLQGGVERAACGDFRIRDIMLAIPQTQDTKEPTHG